MSLNLNRNEIKDQQQDVIEAELLDEISKLKVFLN